MLYKEIRRVARDGGVLEFDDDNREQKAENEAGTQAQSKEIPQKITDKWHRI